MKKVVSEYVPLFAFLGLYLGGALQLIGKKSFDPVGPYKYPLFLAILAIILSVLLLIRAVRKGKNSDTPPLDKKQAFCVILVGAVSAAYLFLMQFVGYIILTPIYIAALLIILGKREWKSIVLISLGATAVLYLPFRFVFNVLFPGGFLAFL